MGKEETRSGCCAVGCAVVHERDDRRNLVKNQVLLLAREQFHLDLIQVYLKGRQSIFKNVTGQLVVFGTIVSLGCVAQPRLFLS